MSGSLWRNALLRGACAAWWTACGGVGAAEPVDLNGYAWQQANPSAPWAPRAGLEAVELEGRLFVMGGRTPVDPNVVPVFGASVLWGDVWRSDDRGATWTSLLDSTAPGHWAPRAYFEAVAHDGRMYVLGGQDFNVVANPAPFGPPLIAVSNFFNDVWSSSDGTAWVQETTPESSASRWAGRAGLSSIVFRDELYVLGGSKNDDSAIVGPGGPAREYFNDVWKSSDGGRTWQQAVAHAPWSPRAGAAVVVKDDYLYLLGGEDGFVCDAVNPRCPPYFNDVWRTPDGATWELVTAAAGWAGRPGHVANVVGDQIVVFGGFGLSTDPTNPFLPANPMDMWASPDGAAWQKLPSSPWNAGQPEQIKYDFDSLTVLEGPTGRPAIYTFGGDRETFNPFDPVNYLRVDNDVWRYAPIPEPNGFALALLAAAGAAARRRPAADGPITA
jgi:hypothetical protein